MSDGPCSAAGVATRPVCFTVTPFARRRSTRSSSQPAGPYTSTMSYSVEISASRDPLHSGPSSTLSSSTSRRPSAVQQTPLFRHHWNASCNSSSHPIGLWSTTRSSGSNERTAASRSWERSARTPPVASASAAVGCRAVRLQAELALTGNVGSFRMSTDGATRMPPQAEDPVTTKAVARRSCSTRARARANERRRCPRPSISLQTNIARTRDISYQWWSSPTLTV